MKTIRHGSIRSTKRFASRPSSFVVSFWSVSRSRSRIKKQVMLSYFRNCENMRSSTDATTEDSRFLSAACRLRLERLDATRTTGTIGTRDSDYVADYSASKVIIIIMMYREGRKKLCPAPICRHQL